MPSTYTLNNGIELIGTGEQSGTWGDTTNTNLELLDTALDGQVTITATSAGSSSSPNDLPISDGSASNGRNRMVIITSATDLGADVYFQLTPNDAEKIIYVRNDLNAQDLILFQGTYNASNDYVVPNGKTAVIFFDGAGSGAVAANVLSDLQVEKLSVVGTAPTITLTDTDTGVDTELNAASSVGQFTLNIDKNNEGSSPRLVTQISGTEFFRINESGAVFNESGNNQDFRVESDTNANMLFVDASSNKVGIGTSAPQTILEIKDSSPILRLEDSAVGSKRIEIGVGSDSVAFVNAPQSAQTLKNSITGTESLTQYHNTDGVVVNEGGADRNFRIETSGGEDTFFVDGGTDRVSVGTTGDLGGKFSTLGLMVGGSGSATEGGALIASRYNGAGGLGTGDFLGVITNEKATGAFGLAYGLYGDSVAQGYLSSYDNFSGGRGIVEIAQSNIRIKNQRVSAATAVGTSVTLQELAKFTQTKSHFNDDGVDLDFIIETDGHANAFNVNASEDHISFFGTSNAAMDGVQGIQVGDSTSTSTGIGMATANHSFLMYIDNSNDLFALYDSTNNADRMRLLSDGTFVFNETGAQNADFRVESNNNAYALFVDSGAQSVSIGTSESSGVAGDGLRVRSNAVGSTSSAALSLGGTGGDFYAITYYNNATDYVTYYSVSSGATNYVQTFFTDAGQSISNKGVHRIFSTGTVEYEPADAASFIWNEGSADANFRIESNDANAIFFVDGGNNRIGLNNSSPTAFLDVSPSSGTMQQGGTGVIRARPIYSGNRFFSAFQAMGSLSGSSATGGMHIGAISDNNGDITSGQYYATSGYYTPVSTSATKISMSGETIAFYADSGLTAGTNHFPTELMRVTASNVVVNEQSYDRDFRVESDDRVNALLVDGASDYVGIGGQQTGATALYVQGGISQSSSQYDPVLASNITIDSPLSNAAGGSIEAVYGMQGTSRAGSKFEIEYAANSWKSFVFEIEFASTRGFVKVVLGGYNNAGLTYAYDTTDPNTMLTSVSAATTSTTTTNQGVKVSLTMNAADVHPMFRVKYSQSGGDSVPRGDRLYFTFDY